MLEMHRTCPRFTKFLVNTSYTFATNDAGNDSKVLCAIGFSCPSLVDIQAKYKIPDNNKSKDGLDDLAEEIIDRVNYGSVKLEPAFRREF